MLIALAVFAGVSALISCSLDRTDAASPKAGWRALSELRVGGVPMMIGMLAGLACVATVFDAVSEIAWIGSAAVLIFVVSYLDDLGGINAAGRLLVHFVAALIFLCGDFWLAYLEAPGLAWALPAHASIVVSLLFVAWMVNLYNFMDGIDGLAGGMGVIGFAWLAILGGIDGNSVYMTSCLVVSAATAGFLRFNFAPARLLMGDTGSTLLGFLAAAMCLWGSRDGIFPLWIGLVIFSPFIVDATLTLLRRLWHGERVWEAHRTHFYQRLLALGWPVERLTNVAYALMFACGFGAVLASHASAGHQWLLLVVVVVTYAALVDYVRRRERSVFRPAPLHFFGDD